MANRIQANGAKPLVRMAVQTKSSSGRQQSSAHDQPIGNDLEALDLEIDPDHPNDEQAENRQVESDSWRVVVIKGPDQKDQEDDHEANQDWSRERVGSCCQEITTGLERHRAVGRQMDPIEAQPHHRPADENDERNYPRAGPKDLQGQRPAASGGGLPSGIGAAQVTTSPEA